MSDTQEIYDDQTLLTYLDGLKNYERSGALEVPTTDRITALVAALGNPHRSYPVIHVTGTNGKGSITAMIASLLAGQGLRVGTYTSPHVDRLAERITVNGEPVEQAELAEAIGKVERAATRLAMTPSWFEAVTAAGLWLLAVRSVDVAVVEVGMLGRWDATNVVDGTVAVISNVQLDHTDMAGPSRAAIAKEKAGIIKPGATLVLGEPDPDLRSIFALRNPAQILTLGRELSWANRQPGQGGSIVDLVNPWGSRKAVSVGMAGAFQCTNALLALSAAEAFTGSQIATAAVSAALTRTRLPGRFEIVHVNPTVLLDGAHNPAAAGALSLAVTENFPGLSPRVLLCGTLAGRDPIEFLEHFGAHAVELLVATEPASPRAMSAHVLAEAAQTLGMTTMTVADPAQALEAAMLAAGSDGLVIATGSLYLIGSLRTAAARLSRR